jgi:hypothetical protein
MAQTLSDLDWLLRDLCVRQGFCNRLSAADLVRPGTSLDPGSFACAVLRAEGLVPEYEQKYMKAIRAAFVDRFGPSFTAPGEEDQAQLD